MKIHIQGLHCPIRHHDGDVMCVHTAETVPPANVSPLNGNVYDRMRSEYPALRAGVTEVTERLDSFASGQARRVAATPSNTVRRSVSLRSPIRERFTADAISPQKAVAGPSTSSKKSVSRPSKSPSKSLVSPPKKPQLKPLPARKSPQKKRSYSEANEGSSESTSSSSEDDDPNRAPGFNPSKKQRRGKGSEDGTYRYRPQADIDIPASEVVPESLTSPEKAEAEFDALRAPVKFTPVGKPAAMSRGKKDEDDSYRYRAQPDIDIPPSEVVPDSLTSPERLEAEFNAQKKATSTVKFTTGTPKLKPRAKSTGPTASNQMAKDLRTKVAGMWVSPGKKRKVEEVGDEEKEDKAQVTIKKARKTATKKTPVVKPTRTLRNRGASSTPAVGSTATPEPARKTPAKKAAVKKAVVEEESPVKKTPAKAKTPAAVKKMPVKPKTPAKPKEKKAATPKKGGKKG
jgi:hypothetical protein